MPNKKWLKQFSEMKPQVFRVPGPRYAVMKSKNLEINSIKAEHTDKPLSDNRQSSALMTTSGNHP
jgi:hypothetical protein